LDRLANNVRLIDGQRLVAGLRPEHLVPRETESATASPDLRFEADVGLTEWLGPELYLSVTAAAGGAAGQADQVGEAGDTGRGASQTLSVRVDPRLAVRAGERIELTFDPGALQLFDGQTERRLDLEG
jgi:multiple sugar transport system ATP-binding protein